MKICTVTTIKTSLKNTLAFVNYHVNVGIDKLYLFFDDPNDEAIGVLDQNLFVKCIRCTDDHWIKYCGERHPTFFVKQRANATYAVEMARIENYSWIAHIDSDELIFSKNSLKRLLGSVNKKSYIIYLRVFEAIPINLKHENLFEEIIYFKETVSPGSIKNAIGLSKKLGLIFFRSMYKIKMMLFKLCGSRLKHTFIIGHEQGKCFVRTRADFQVYDVHYPNTKSPLKFDYLHQVKLLHYEAPTFSKWNNKWNMRINGSQNYIFGSQKEIELAELFKKTENDDDKKSTLYKNLYYLPKKDFRLLLFLRLIKKIKIHSHLWSNKINRQAY